MPAPLLQLIIFRKLSGYWSEPSNVDDAYRSLISGKIEFNESTNTIADGLRTNLGSINFPIIQNYVKRDFIG